MALSGKRNSYKAQLYNSESLGSNLTIMPVLISSIKEEKSKKGSPFYKLQCIAMVKGDTFVKVRPVDGAFPKVKRVKIEDDVSVEVEEDAKGTVVVPNQKFTATCFDRTASSVDAGSMVKLAMTADIYDGRFTFKADNLIMERNMDALSKVVYDKHIKSSDLALVPCLGNMRVEDFPEGTDPRYMSRTFILPLSNDTESFSDVHIELDESDRSRFYCKQRDDVEHRVGINCSIGGDKIANMLPIVYSPNDTSKPKIFFKAAYKPDVWDVFGVYDLDKWADAGARLIFHAKQWFMYGYSQLEKIESMKGNLDNTGDENGESFDYSTGFVVKMGINMTDTVRAAGLRLSYDYVNKNYGSDSDYSNDTEITHHTLNTGWKIKCKQNKKFCINLTDLTDTQMHSFLKEAKERNFEFYGVFPVGDDSIYEFEGTPEEQEKNVVEKQAKPSLLFAINN